MNDTQISTKIAVNIPKER